jgi:hypothetical protein
MVRIELPFGFNVSIGNIRNDFNITQNGATVAGLSTVCSSPHSRRCFH